MNQRFAGRVAIVTGGASGIGEAIARRLAREGAQGVVFDVDTAGLERVAADIPAAALKVDISEEAEVQAAIAEVVAQFGRLDILVNSAGIVGPTSTKIVDYASQDFRRVLGVNLIGSFHITKYALPAMLANHYGRILLIASIAGKDGNPGMAGYTASKAGVIGLVKGIGKEYAETGVTVNGLAPAVIRTPLNEQTSPEQMRYMTDRIPMRRLGTVDEVAALACWIVSEEASFNTGFVFDLTGGRATY
ncbi:MAG TPA: SDR family NAD(P)-dependent oxidoreductase [Anaerolinea sp.]|nr:SDR family NAD(P)-dependent oxidoreductase [Anaerolinea sp.]